ncbi:MAG: P-loop NTPase [Spirochaetales bacterium]|nr:P-loop NTPase [Spirochaetales bacterium]
MRIRIAVSSGKGGTGKTFIATNLARVLEKAGEKAAYLDCDVEAPNGHLFVKPVIGREEEATLLAPAGIDEERCTACGKCAEVCRYHAIARVGTSMLFFRNLCHVCGACTLVCPHKAIIERPRKIGTLREGARGGIEFRDGLLETGEGGMTPRLIRRVKEWAGGGVVILDSPPGTSCPVVETVKDADLCVLVTDPTPFGLNDLKLAVAMCRELDKEPVVVVNRAGYADAKLKEYCSGEGLAIVAEIPDDRAVAECYSVGDLAVDRFPEYDELFRALALELCERALKTGTARKTKRPAARPSGVRSTAARTAGADRTEERSPAESGTAAGAPAGAGRNGRAVEVTVISGKGGTGKTSLVACFAALGKEIAVADCDVDAADLHLVLKPRIAERGVFSGGVKASIDLEKCLGCGACARVCRFGAVSRVPSGGSVVFGIDERGCEGCGACSLVCPADAVAFHPAANGEWYVSETEYGPMTHARLYAAEENSGKLVSLVRERRNTLAAERGLEWSLSDGSPGTGCPVIASLTGTDYAIVVTEPTVSGVHDVRRVLDLIRFFKLRSGVAVNKHDLNPAKTAEIRALAAEYGADFLGTVPYDTAVTEAQIRGKSIVEHDPASPSALAIAEVWRRVKDELEVKNDDD